MKGIINFYINFHPELGQDVQGTIATFRECNKETLSRIDAMGEYLIAVIPTTKESCRIEKMDFDKPFPRFVSKSHIDLAELERRKEERAIEREAARMRNDANIKDKGQ